MLPRGQCGWIELKTAAGALSDAQIAFRQACLKHGHGHVVCRSLEEVEAAAARWLAAYGLKLRARVTPAGAFQLEAAR